MYPAQTLRVRAYVHLCIFTRACARVHTHTHTHTHTGDKYAVIIGQHGVNLSADAGLTWRPAPHNLNIADTSAVQDAYLSSATDARYPTAVLSSLETGALPLHTDVLLLDFALSSGRAHNTSASSGVVWKSAVVSIAGVVAVASQRGREGGRERETHTHVNFSISRTSVLSTHTHTCRCRPNCLIYVFNFFFVYHSLDGSLRWSPCSSSASFRALIQQTFAIMSLTVCSLSSEQTFASVMVTVCQRVSNIYDIDILIVHLMLSCILIYDIDEESIR